MTALFASLHSTHTTQHQEEMCFECTEYLVAFLSQADMHYSSSYLPSDGDEQTLKAKQIEKSEHMYVRYTELKPL